MTGVRYKDYVLHAVPYPRPNNRWSTDVRIEREVGSETLVGSFHSLSLWNSKEEAEAHSIAFGKQIIDGIAEGVTLDF